MKRTHFWLPKKNGLLLTDGWIIDSRSLSLSRDDPLNEIVCQKDERRIANNANLNFTLLPLPLSDCISHNKSKSQKHHHSSANIRYYNNNIYKLPINMSLLSNSSEPTVVPNVTAAFIAEKFRNEEGVFDSDKARGFAKELRTRRKTLQQQVHDTRYSERILRDVYTNRDALKNAHKKSTFGGMGILQGLDRAVIPQADRIVQMIEEEAPEETIRMAAEEFVRVYSPYEMPVSYWFCVLKVRL